MGVEFIGYSRIKTEPLPNRFKILNKQDEFFQTIAKENDFISVCFETNTIYRTTPETIVSSAKRSYSGYDDFVEELRSLDDKMFTYLPYFNI